MNTNVKAVLIFIIGAGMGAFTARTILKNKYEEIFQEEMESIKDTLERDYCDRKEKRSGRYSWKEGPQEESNVVEEKENPFCDKYGHPIKRPYEEAKTCAEDEPKVTKIEKHQYKKIARDYGYAEKERLMKREYLDEVVGQDKPCIITIEEFSEGAPNHEKLTLYYYGLDDTLVDEGEEIVCDPDTLIGVDTLNDFEGNEAETIFVRNDKMDADYEVIFLNKSYKECVLGYTPEDKQDNSRRSGVDGK